MKKDWTSDRQYQRRQSERAQVLAEKLAMTKGKDTPFYDPKALKEKYR